MSESSSDDTEQKSGSWLGSVQGLRVRYPGPDADGPILEIHGERGMAAMEFDDDAFVDGLSHTAAEIQMILDDTDTDRSDDDLVTDGGVDQSSSGIGKTFTPICPDCGAEGERQRRVRSKWRCLDCGNRYDRTDTDRSGGHE